MFEKQVGDRITLMLRHREQAEETFRLIRKNHALREWMQWYDLVKTVEDSLQNIEANIEGWELKTDLHLGVYYDGKMAGMISLHNINHIVRKAAMGYWLDKEHEGKGIITRSAKSLLATGFEELGLNRIVIGAAVTNRRSRAIPERLGFRLEGVLRQNILLHGTYHDMAVYSMLKSEFINE